MTDKQIQEGNKLIVVFMGYEIIDRNGYDAVVMKPELTITSGNIGLYSEYLNQWAKYHSSWDWLMPVVEKIPTLNPDKGKLWFEYKIIRAHCLIWSNRGDEWKNNGGTTISATFKTVIDFITWYNTQPKPQ